MADEKDKPFHVVTKEAMARRSANAALDEITRDLERGMIGCNTAISMAFVAGLEYARRLYDGTD
jgi:hypothetical protein